MLSPLFLPTYSKCFIRASACHDHDKLLCLRIDRHVIFIFCSLGSRWVRSFRSKRVLTWSLYLNITHGWLLFWESCSISHNVPRLSYALETARLLSQINQSYKFVNLRFFSLDGKKLKMSKKWEENVISPSSNNGILTVVRIVQVIYFVWHSPCFFSLQYREYQEYNGNANVYNENLNDSSMSGHD